MVEEENQIHAALPMLIPKDNTVFAQSKSAPSTLPLRVACLRGNRVWWCVLGGGGREGQTQGQSRRVLEWRAAQVLCSGPLVTRHRLGKLPAGAPSATRTGWSGP
mmetsp:Transcript_43158/g.67480  ORF Transcript_43158/g.67480 Transcript_43158/m.67480 type:complete len:105 (+) Transcript_43158:36-350(+)